MDMILVGAFLLSLHLLKRSMKCIVFAARIITLLELIVRNCTIQFYLCLPHEMCWLYEHISIIIIIIRVDAWRGIYSIVNTPVH